MRLFALGIVGLVALVAVWRSITIIGIPIAIIGVLGVLHLRGICAALATTGGALVQHKTKNPTYLASAARASSCRRRPLAGRLVNAVVVTAWAQSATRRGLFTPRGRPNPGRIARRCHEPDGCGDRARRLGRRSPGCCERASVVPILRGMRPENVARAHPAPEIAGAVAEPDLASVLDDLPAAQVSAWASERLVPRAWHAHGIERPTVAGLLREETGTPVRGCR
jgi:hypothetical protein